MFQFQVIDPATLASLENKENSSNGDTTDSITKSDNDVSQYKIGDLVICENLVGTVKYIGQVNPHPGKWLGIEWDDAERGKHDGTVNGVKYFSTVKEGAGSFVRPFKVKKCKSITEAITERYQNDPAILKTVEDIDGGLERRRVQLGKLKILEVQSYQIFNTEEPGVLAKITPLLESLSIANNFIRNWEAVGNLCLGLNNLKEINVSGNPLQKVPEVISEALGTVFQQLKTVVLGHVGYDWDDIRQASIMWKSVETLHVPWNKVSNLSPFDCDMTNLKNLDLSNNNIISWAEVLKLNCLPSLQVLNLCGNRISEIRFCRDAGKLAENPTRDRWFPNLVKLTLTDNRIQGWNSVNAIGMLKSMSDLRINGNPFLESDTRDTNRQMIVARLPQLQKLEGAEISKRERRDAELDYVKKFETKYKASDPKEFLEHHPRFLHLANIYGLLDEPTEAQNSSTGGQTTFINLHLYTPHDGQVLIKKILQNMTVQKLKILLQRIYRVPGAQLRIKAISGKNANITFNLENDFFELSQYSLEDGDKLCINW